MTLDHANARLRRRSLLLAALTVPVVRAALAQGSAPAAIPGGANPVHDMLAERVLTGRDSLGYVAAIFDAGVTRLVTVGQSGAEDGRPLDGDTVFEIGSITKVFTALLLADMVQRGEVALSDPLGKYLPPDAQPREFDGKPITLLDVVTYTAGLPRMPGNIRSKDPANPYADYTTAQLYGAVASTTPLYYPGSHYEYANFGFALLGQALSLRAGTSYEDLVVSRICTPLGMADTRITLTPEMQQRLAPGHDSALQRVPNWDLPAVAGAGALRSTANDLLRFLDCCSGRVPSPLAKVASSLLEVRRQTDHANQYAAEGWFVRTQYGDELVWKDGATGGYSSFIGYSTRKPRAVVLLANSSSPATTPEIGKHLVNSAFPLPPLLQPIAIDPASLAAYAGRYPLTPRFVLTVTPQNGRLMVQATGQDAAEVFPESKTRFFYRIVDAQLTFEFGADGMASAVVLHQNGRDLRAERAP